VASGFKVPKFGQPLTVKPSETAHAAGADSADKRRAQVEASRAAMAHSALAVKAPGSSAPTLNPTSDSAVLWMPVAEIEPYEKNPRRDENSAYDEIKASIRVSGLDMIFAVTKIPGSNRYTCARGANTRLRILQELWKETRDPRFERVMVQVVMWHGHAAAIADHVKENTLRGDMTYWDKACACKSIREEIAAETKEVPGVRELAKLLSEKYGFVVDQAALSRYLHVAEHFEPIKTHINNPTAKQLIPATNALLRLAFKWDLTEAQAWEDMQAALSSHAGRLAGEGGPFDAQACIFALQMHMALRLNLTAYQLEFALSALERDANAVRADLITTPEPMALASALHRPEHCNERADNEDFSHGTENFDSADQGFAPAEFQTPQLEESAGVSRRTSSPQSPPTAAFVSPAETALRLANEIAPAAQSTQGPTVHSPVPARATSAALTVDAALESVINAAADFAEACFVGEWLVTGHALPYGYFMEVRDPEVDGISFLRDPVPGCDDARVRVGGWWLAASLCRQWDVDETLLLPPKSGWRLLWSRENEEVMSVGHNNLWVMIQDGLGGIIGDDGAPAIQIEYVCAVLTSTERARCFSNLTQAVQQLSAARNGGR